MVDLDPLVVGVVVAMALVTYATKAGGLWLLGRVDVGERTEAGLDALPGAIIVAIVAPELVDGGPPEWTAAALAAVVAWKTENLLAALVVAMVAVVALRSL
ncbi:AzlD domain-containing protein [Natronomonas salina]|nr:AzlD domain-containing protein [Natronomonas salina]QLD88003.1 AzlD domain-containing protein [Natronomonas salina]